VEPEHDKHERSRTFGTVAEQYDRARPTYPRALVEDLLAANPVDVVDVGCGTGKAGRLFLGEGRRVVGVEPDPRMAAVARRHGLEVEIGPFETWDAGDRRFDLLVSGQAWHWVDPVKGAEKAASLLRPGGRFAAFWNGVHLVPEIHAALRQAYDAHAPDLTTTTFALGSQASAHEEDGQDDKAGTALAAGPFTGVTPGHRQRYSWALTYTPHEWAENVATHSDHRLLSPKAREPLLAAIEEALQTLGPSFEVSYTTELLSATRQ
jgi:SAM-dependent methyltransferase